MNLFHLLGSSVRLNFIDCAFLQFLMQNLVAWGALGSIIMDSL